MMICCGVVDDDVYVVSVYGVVDAINALVYMVVLFRGRCVDRVCHRIPGVVRVVDDAIVVCVVVVIVYVVIGYVL